MIEAAARRLRELPRMSSVALASMVILLAIDLVLIGVHLWRLAADPGGTGVIGAAPGWVERPEAGLQIDGGYAEWFNYLQLSVAAALLGFLAVRRRAPVFAAWAFVLLLALADDSLSLHEEGAEAIIDRLGSAGAPGFGAGDSSDFQEWAGQLAVWAGLGIVAVVALVVAHRASDRAARTTSWQLVFLLAALAFFAVLVDLLSIAVKEAGVGDSPDLENFVMIVLEDGGELVVCSLILVAVLAAATAAGPRRPREGPAAAA